MLVALLAGGSTATICDPISVFGCVDDEDCVAEAGEGAECEAISYCSLPDAGCEGTMRRWHDRAASDIAGECVDSAVGGTGAPDDGSGSGTASGASADMADEIGESGGEMQTCDERYGTVSDYELCEETSDSCSFNAAGTMTTSCDAICEMFGGTCLAANLNETDPCTSEGPTTCDAMELDDTICICSRG